MTTISDIYKTYREAIRGLETSAQRERQRIAREVTVQHGKVEGQRATLQSQLKTILDKLKATETMELRKRDLPITKPSRELLAHIKASREDVQQQVAKHKTELANLTAQLKTAETEALADLTKQIREQQAELDKWQREAEADYKRGETATKEWEAKHLKLDTGEWIDKSYFAKLDKDAQDYLHEYGVTDFNELWIPAHEWLAKSFREKYRQLDNGEWITKESYDKLDANAKAYVNQLGIKDYNELYIPAQTWLAGFGSKPWLAEMPTPTKPKLKPGITVAGITLPKELAWAGLALPVVTATPIPFDDAVLWAIIGAGAAYAAIRATGTSWNTAFKLKSTTMQDIIEGIPAERIKLQDIFKGFPTEKLTIKDITEGFPYTTGKIEDIMTHFPLTQTRLADITEQIPLVKQKLEDTMTIAVASAEAGRKVVNASGGFIESPKVSSAMGAWQTALGKGVIRDIQEAMANADRAVDAEYKRRVRMLQGQEHAMDKAEYARQFNALEQSHLVWDRSIKVYNAKLNDFAVATDELVASISPEPVKVENLTTQQKLAISAYVASLLSKLYVLPKPEREATASQYITQNIVVPQTIPEIVHMAAIQTVLQAREQGLTKPQVIAQAVPATQAIIKTTAMPTTAMPATQIRALVRPAVLEAVATPTQTLTRARPYLPPPPFRIPLPDGTTLILTEKQFKGIIAWKQGFMYKMIYPPYGVKNIVNSRKPLAGVKYYSGAGSATKSIIAKGGVVPKVLLRDMGIMDIRFVTPKGGRKPKIHFKRDVKQRTTVTPQISTMQ